MMDTNFFESKKRLEALLEKPGWSQVRLAEESGLSQATISKFLNDPERGLHKKSWKKLVATLEREIGPSGETTYVRNSQNGAYALDSSAGFRNVPVIDVRRYPMGHQSDDVRFQRICELADTWIVLPVSDPFAYGVRLAEGVEGKAAPGSYLIVGPKTTSLMGDFVAAEHNGKLRIAHKTEFQGKNALRFPPNEFEAEESARVVGKVLGKWEPW